MAASISGRIASIASGTRNGFITRRSAVCGGPSTSAMPAVGIARPRGMPAMPS